MLKSKLWIAAFALALTTPALADPPRWAPAHGWRAKHAHPHGHRSVVLPPRPYYYPPPHVHFRRPAVYARIDGDFAVIGGAVIGAVIGAHLAGR